MNTEFPQGLLFLDLQMCSKALDRGDNPSGESYFGSRPTGAIIPLYRAPHEYESRKVTLVKARLPSSPAFAFSSFRYSNNHCINVFEYSSFIHTLVT